MVFSGVSRSCNCELAATEFRVSTFTPDVRLTSPPPTRLNDGRSTRPTRSPPRPVSESIETFRLRIDAKGACPPPPLTVPWIVVKTVVPEKTRFRSPAGSTVVPTRLPAAPGPVILICTLAPWGVV